MAYDTASDSWDVYLRMFARTSQECLYKFSKCVVKLYSKVCLHKPNKKDIEKLYSFHAEKHGFPDMLGSIDYTHWPWRNCPNAWRAQFTRGDQGHPLIMLEAVCSQDPRVWHAFYGVAGSSNDLNVLARFEVFNDIIKGKGPNTSFMLNGVPYKHGYYLADGIYPKYSVIVKTIPNPPDDKRKKYAKFQEAKRIDVEHLFSVLKARWNIIQNLARAWTPKGLRLVMYACTVMHNMVIEDEDWALCEYDLNDIFENFMPVNEGQQESNMWALHDSHVHANLCADLIDHIWNNFRADPDPVNEDDE